MISGSIKSRGPLQFSPLDTQAPLAKLSQSDPWTASSLNHSHGSANMNSTVQKTKQFQEIQFQENNWKRWFIGEAVGTFLLVFFGCGAVAGSILHQAHLGLFQVAIIWGLGLAVAIQISGPLSGAHLNPAITTAFITTGQMPWTRALFFILAQFIGAFVSACLLYLLFSSSLSSFESSNNIERGSIESFQTAKIFGEYYLTNERNLQTLSPAPVTVNSQAAFTAEALGTALLAFIIFSLTQRKKNVIPEPLIPYAIGFSLTVLISVFAPISMAGFNPARDLAPRIFSSIAGWDSIPFEFNGVGWWLVYITAPITGAIIGAQAAKAFNK